MGDPVRISLKNLVSEDYSLGDIVWPYVRNPMFSRFDTISECDRHTDRHTTTVYTVLDIASRGTKQVSIFSRKNLEAIYNVTTRKQLCNASHCNKAISNTINIEIERKQKHKYSKVCIVLRIILFLKKLK